MITCKVCEMEFKDEVRFERHFKTHLNKTKKQKKPIMPDFDIPDFSQVM